MIQTMRNRTSSVKIQQHIKTTQYSFYEPTAATPHIDMVHKHSGAGKQAGRKELGKEATELGNPCIIPITYAFLGM